MAEAPTVEQLEEHLRVFGLAPGASLDEIKKRKSFMAKVMHEDVVAENMKDQAREEMIRINLAWEQLNAWFKANPEAKETPKNEKKQTSSGGQASTSSDDDDEDWEAWERRKKAQWKGEGVTLEQLDLQRRTELAKKSRRGLVANCKIYAGVGLGLWFFLLCIASAFASGALFLPQLLCLGSIAVYLCLLFHPLAKQKIDKWVEKAE